MIRHINAQDLPNFPNIKILSHKKNNGQQKDYLLIERPPFVSCFVTINKQYGIFIEQYRPIIAKTTLEMPMGKIEAFESKPQEALIRELKEECNLFLEDNAFILVKENNNIRRLDFESFELKAYPPNYLSPGFSTSIQHPFILNLQYSSGKYDQYSLFAQEEDLKVHLKKLSPSLIHELDGASRFYLINFLYEQSFNID
ncbi:MAG: NUDIX domain-containing protein [Brevinema sp.]